MKASQFCLLVAIAHMVPHIPPTAAAVVGVVWLVNAAFWWRIEK